MQFLKSFFFAPVVALILVTGCVDREASSRKDQSKALITPSPDHVHNGSRAQAAEVWTCPMHPHIKKDGPGTCPICSMSLVKASNEEPVGESESHEMPEGHASFDLTLHRQQMIGVKLGVVQKRTLYQSIEAAGRVAFDPELYTAQNEYLEAVRQLVRVKDSPIADVRHSAESMVESSKLRLKILGLSDQQIQKIGKTGASGANLLLPQKGENILVYAEVFEMDLPNVQSGLEAKISGGSLGERELMGKVTSVDRVINPVTRTAKVRIQIPNARSELRPESFVDVAIRSPLGEQITVPFDSVLDTGKEAWVFVSKEKGRFEPRLIGIKFRADDQVAIASGVSPGEKIVTSANFLIDSESRLKGVLFGQASNGVEPESGASMDDQDSRSSSREKETPAGGAAKVPVCPKGQFWHAEMKHCMPKTGG